MNIILSISLKRFDTWLRAGVCSAWPGSVEQPVLCHPSVGEAECPSCHFIHLFHGSGMLELCCRVSRDDLEVEQCQTKATLLNFSNTKYV